MFEDSREFVVRESEMGWDRKKADRIIGDRKTGVGREKTLLPLCPRLSGRNV
jgi:hypothetical protein